MSNPVIYARIDVYWNSALLMEEATVEVTRKTNSQMVSSVQKDYAGESPGAKTLEIRVVSGIPSAGFELNPGAFMTNLTFGTISLFMAGKTLSSTGQIIEDSIAHGVNQESKLTFSFRGNYADWV